MPTLQETLRSQLQTQVFQLNDLDIHLRNFTGIGEIEREFLETLRIDIGMLIARLEALPKPTDDELDIPSEGLTKINNDMRAQNIGPRVLALVKAVADLLTRQNNP